MRSYYKGVARDQYGAIIGGATIAIYLAGTTTVASVYTVSTGGTAVNSVTADVDGVFYFYVDTSDYSNIQLFKLVISYLGNTTTYDNISAFYYDNYYIDALGEYGSGTAYTQSTIEAALTAIGTTNKATMLLRPGTWAVTADLTIPANVTLKIPAGAVLSIATGKTLTINGSFEAGLYQVFDCVGTGTIVFGSGSVAEVYPEWWGENTVPGTTDMTAALNAAVMAHDTVKLSSTTYFTDAIRIPSNTTIKGNGITSILQQSEVSPNTAGSIFYVVSPSTGTYISNIHISNLKLYNSKGTFYEFTPLVTLSGVKNIYFEGVYFVGMRGDGLYIADVLNNGRQNININVNHCIFDGVNNANRGGISIITAKTVKIKDNIFINLTSSGMPGAIDIEPDAIPLTCLIQDIEISGNYFGAVKGNAVISLSTTAAPSLTNNIRKIIIENNYFDKDNIPYHIAGFTIYMVTAEDVTSIPSMTIIIRNNIFLGNDTGSGTIPFPLYIDKINGLTIEGNTFHKTYTCYLGQILDGTETLRDINIINNNFYLSGGLSYMLAPLGIGSISRLNIVGNTFYPSSTDLGAIYFYGSNAETPTISDMVKIIGNTFIKGTSQTYSIFAIRHTLSYQNNVWKDNIENYQFNNSFLSQVTLDDTGTPFILNHTTYVTGGTTTITNFLPRTDFGKIITIMANHNITITDGSYIFLSGSVNFVMKPGDTLTLLCNGDAKWYEVSRSVN